jgi:Protein of unknown function (DUF2909)
MDPIKLLILVIFGLIVWSFGSAAWYLTRNGGDGRKFARALTWRIALSVGLFILLYVLYRNGLIKPYSVYAPRGG